MKLDKKLNLVLPIEKGWLHATPIGFPVFEKYFLHIAEAFAGIYRAGLGTMAGPRIAAMMLKKVAEEDGSWEGAEGVEAGLMNEIRRLANVVLLGKHGYETIPLYTAMQQDMLSEEEISEVENALVFFTLASSMHKGVEKKGIITSMTKFWGGLTTPLDSTEYARSLRTSIEEETTGEKVIPSSIPS